MGRRLYHYYQERTLEKLPKPCPGWWKLSLEKNDIWLIMCNSAVAGSKYQVPVSFLSNRNLLQWTESTLSHIFEKMAWNKRTWYFDTQSKLSHKISTPHFYMTLDFDELI